mmetsp:Transcript_10014/g.25866  ORF Transcript_10014/g.25866 Transcript_10014/m.25866 type:complete len:214 (-) Transcript_10014:171-812(-)
MTTEYSAVARAVLLLTIFQSCIPLAGLRQRRRLVLPLTVHHLRACRRPLDSSVARDARYRGIIFASDGVDGRSAERERKSPQPRSFQQRHKSSDPSHPRLRLVDSAALVITQRRPAHGIALQQHASTRAVRTTRELLPCSTRTKRGTQPCTRMLRPEESIGLHACDAVCVLVTLWRGSAKVVWRCVCFMRHAVCLGRCVTARVCQIRATAQSR